LIQELSNQQIRITYKGESGMKIEEAQQDVIKHVIGDRVAIPPTNFEWLLQQAKKVERYEKALHDIQSAYEEDLSHVQACRKMVKIADSALKEGDSESEA
jgi:hypothetical protein